MVAIAQMITAGIKSDGVPVPVATCQGLFYHFTKKGTKKAQ